jgi:dTMP kinase
MKINLEKISNRNKNTSSELCFFFPCKISTGGCPLTRPLALRATSACAVPSSAPSASNPLITYHSSLITSLFCPCARLDRKSMPTRGKFIVLEGIDGSGKRTQLEMLARAFTTQGIPFAQVGFPRYDGFFGKLVAQFLNGDFGPLESVDPHFSALLYAADRREATPELEANLACGQTLLADRYIASNLAHQGARVPRENRAEFLAWLKQLEYQVYALPPEDLVIYLRVPAAEAHRLIGEKGKRDYTNLQRDLQESNLAHLTAASEVYDELARQPNWLKMECYDAAAHALRAPEEIHKEILAAIAAHAFPALRASH